MNAADEDKENRNDNSDDEIIYDEEFDYNVLCEDKCKSKNWMIDSGACFYICNHKKALSIVKSKMLRLNLPMVETCMLRGYVPLG